MENEWFVWVVLPGKETTQVFEVHCK